MYAAIKIIKQGQLSTVDIILIMAEYDYSSGWYIGLSHKSIDHQNAGLADWQFEEFILLLLRFID